MSIRYKINQLRSMRGELETTDLIEMSEGLSGEENFKDLCLELADEVAEYETSAEAIATRIKELQARKSRMDRSAETLRNVILQALDQNNIKSLPSPCVTLTVNTLKTMEITNESLLPSRFFLPQPPQLDAKALRDAILKDGEVIEGAGPGNDKISLTIRRK